MAGEEQTDAAVIAALEFTPTPKCEAAQCQSAAVVYSVCRGCRRTVPLCPGHVRIARAGMSRIIRCVACPRVGALDAVLRFVPIPVGA